MPSVDVVSTVDMQSLDNATNNVRREITTRFDFKNIRSEITLDRKAGQIHILSGDDWRVKTVLEMLVGQCTRLKVDSKCLDIGKIEATAQGAARVDIRIRQGIPKEVCQQIVKLVKSLKMKVQAAIQLDQVRITGKKIDDLQEIMQLLREQDYPVPLQFVNMKD